MHELILLLLAHLLGDFFFQFKPWIKDKREKKGRSVYLYIHVLLIAAMSWLFLFEWQYWWLALCILLSHYLIDLAKLSLGKNNFYWFLADQIAHILVLVICVAIIYRDELGIKEWIGQVGHTENFLVLLAYAFLTTPVAYTIGLATKKWQKELEEENEEKDSLTNAGMIIGIVERILVLTFVLLGQFQAIGFLIAAKSILRFADKGDKQARKQTEYVLIGTLLSFTIAIFTGLLILHLKS